MADVEVRHLEALSAVAEGGTFARAAEQLGYTQSAVSQQIAALERAVGSSVFDRPGGPRRVELTPVGRVLLDAAQDVLGRLAQARTELDRLRAGVGGRVVIGTFQSVSVSILPRIVERLRAEAPDVEIGLYESDDDAELVARLLAGELDVCFVVRGAETPGLVVTPVASDPWVVVAPRSRSERSAIAPDELDAAPLIGQPSTGCQLLVDRELARHGVEPDYVFRSSDNLAVQAMVRAGVGMSILPLLAVDLDDAGVSICEMDPPMPERTISVVRSERRTPSPVTLRLVELAQEECRVVDERRATLAARWARSTVDGGEAAR